MRLSMILFVVLLIAFDDLGGLSARVKTKVVAGLGTHYALLERVTLIRIAVVSWRACIVVKARVIAQTILVVDLGIVP